MAKIQDTLIFTRPDKDTMFPSQYGELYSPVTDPIRQLMTERKDTRHFVFLQPRMDDSKYYRTSYRCRPRTKLF